MQPLDAFTGALGPLPLLGAGVAFGMSCRRPCGADQRSWASIPLQQAGDLVAAIALGQLQGTIGPLQQVIETAVGGGQG